MKKKIVLCDNPAIRKKSKEVGRIDASIQKIIKDLVDTMRGNLLGVGLSAPQINEHVRIIAYEYIKAKGSKETIPDIPLKVLINPKIIKTSKTTNVGEEGCLSVPQLYGQVRRFNKVTISALDEFGKPIKFIADDFEARILQHEIDHLDGILFVDRLVEPKLYTYE